MLISFNSRLCPFIPFHTLLPTPHPTAPRLTIAATFLALERCQEGFIRQTIPPGLHRRIYSHAHHGAIITVLTAVYTGRLRTGCPRAEYWSSYPPGWVTRPAGGYFTPSCYPTSECLAGFL